MPLTIGERIAAARKRSGKNQADLASVLDKDVSAISRIESGERRVNSFELGLIAQELGVSTAELLGLPEPAPAMAVAARVAEHPAPRASDQVLTRVRRVLEVEALLDRLGAIPSPKVVTPSFELEGPMVQQGQQMAGWARSEMGLKETPLPEGIARLVEEAFGIDVLVEPLPEALDGLCVRFNSRTLAVVTGSGYPGRRRFTLGHELGHHLFGDSGFVVEEIVESEGEGEAEARANAFAAEFLMPAGFIDRYLRSQHPAEETMVDLMFVLGVSLSALCYRLQNLGYLPPKEAKRIREIGPAALSRRAGRYTDWRLHATPPKEVLRRLPSRLEVAAIDAYQRGLIGIGPLADLFGEGDPEALRAELAEAGVEPHLSDLDLSELEGPHR